MYESGACLASFGIARRSPSSSCSSHSTFRSLRLRVLKGRRSEVPRVTRAGCRPRAKPPGVGGTQRPGVLHGEAGLKAQRCPPALTTRDARCLLPTEMQGKGTQICLQSRPWETAPSPCPALPALWSLDAPCPGLGSRLPGPRARFAPFCFAG